MTTEHVDDIDHDPLAALLERVAHGDEEAFAEVYDVVASRVYGIGLRILTNPALAEEVVQEVFVQMWLGSANFSPERGSAGGWIAMLAHRRAVDKVRSHAATRIRDTSWHEGEHTLGRADFPDFTQSHVETLSIRAALAQLSAPQRQAVELAYLDGHTYQEVALLMCAPIGTTKTRIRAGLARLRELVDAPQINRVSQDRPRLTHAGVE